MITDQHSSEPALFFPFLLLTLCDCFRQAFITRTELCMIFVLVNILPTKPAATFPGFAFLLLVRGDLLSAPRRCFADIIQMPVTDNATLGTRMHALLLKLVSRLQVLRRRLPLIADNARAAGARFAIP